MTRLRWSSCHKGVLESMEYQFQWIPSLFNDHRAARSYRCRVGALLSAFGSRQLTGMPRTLLSVGDILTTFSCCEEKGLRGDWIQKGRMCGRKEERFSEVSSQINPEGKNCSREGAAKFDSERSPGWGTTASDPINGPRTVNPQLSLTTPGSLRPQGHSYPSLWVKKDCRKASAGIDIESRNSYQLPSMCSSFKTLSNKYRQIQMRRPILSSPIARFAGGKQSSLASTPFLDGWP